MRYASGRTTTHTRQGVPAHMTLHAGQSYALEGVQIGPPGLDLIEQAPKAADIADAVAHWLTAAQTRTDVYYFAVYLDHVPLPVGQILLHDIDHTTGESLVGYHLFHPHWRGRGIGTKALQLLQHVVVSTTALRKLVIITSRDNRASQTIARKCGFAYAGTPWEDPVEGVVFAWSVTHNSQAAERDR